jgi:hypothetical protein
MSVNGQYCIAGAMRREAGGGRRGGANRPATRLENEGNGGLSPGMPAKFEVVLMVEDRERSVASSRPNFAFNSN